MSAESPATEAIPACIEHTGVCTSSAIHAAPLPASSGAWIDQRSSVAGVIGALTSLTEDPDAADRHVRFLGNRIHRLDSDVERFDVERVVEVQLVDDVRDLEHEGETPLVSVTAAGGRRLACRSEERRVG